MATKATHTSVFEIAVHFDSIRNIDLLRQGLYFVSARAYTVNDNTVQRFGSMAMQSLSSMRDKTTKSGEKDGKKDKKSDKRATKPSTSGNNSGSSGGTSSNTGGGGSGGIFSAQLQQKTTSDPHSKNKTDSKQLHLTPAQVNSFTCPSIVDRCCLPYNIIGTNEQRQHIIDNNLRPAKPPKSVINAIHALPPNSSQLLTIPARITTSTSLGHTYPSCGGLICSIAGNCTCSQSKKTDNHADPGLIYGSSPPTTTNTITSTTNTQSTLKNDNTQQNAKLQQSNSTNLLLNTPGVSVDGGNDTTPPVITGPAITMPTSAKSKRLQALSSDQNLTPQQRYLLQQREQQQRDVTNTSTNTPKLFQNNNNNNPTSGKVVVDEKNDEKNNIEKGDNNGVEIYPCSRECYPKCRCVIEDYIETSLFDFADDEEGENDKTSRVIPYPISTAGAKIMNLQKKERWGKSNIDHIDYTFQSQIVRLQYFDQSIVLNDCCLFKVELQPPYIYSTQFDPRFPRSENGPLFYPNNSSKQLQLQEESQLFLSDARNLQPTALYFDISLHFCEFSTKTPKTDPKPTLKDFHLVSTRTLCIPDIFLKSTCAIYPVKFDTNYLAMTNVMIHTSLIEHKFRTVSSDEEMRSFTAVFDSDSEDDNTLLLLNQNNSTTSHSSTSFQSDTSNLIGLINTAALINGSTTTTPGGGDHRTPSDSTGITSPWVNVPSTPSSSTSRSLQRQGPSIRQMQLGDGQDQSGTKNTGSRFIFGSTILENDDERQIPGAKLVHEDSVKQLDLDNNTNNNNTDNNNNNNNNTDNNTSSLNPHTSSQLPPHTQQSKQVHPNNQTQQKQMSPHDRQSSPPTPSLTLSDFTSPPQTSTTSHIPTTSPAHAQPLPIITAPTIFIPTQPPTQSSGATNPRPHSSSRNHPPSPFGSQSSQHSAINTNSKGDSSTGRGSRPSSSNHHQETSSTPGIISSAGTFPDRRTNGDNRNNNQYDRDDLGLENDISTSNPLHNTRQNNNPTQNGQKNTNNKTETNDISTLAIVDQDVDSLSRNMSQNSLNSHGKQNQQRSSSPTPSSRSNRSVSVKKIEAPQALTIDLARLSGKLPISSTPATSTGGIPTPLVRPTDVDSNGSGRGVNFPLLNTSTGITTSNNITPHNVPSNSFNMNTTSSRSTPTNRATIQPDFYSNTQSHTNSQQHTTGTGTGINNASANQPPPLTSQPAELVGLQPIVNVTHIGNKTITTITSLSDESSTGQRIDTIKFDHKSNKYEILCNCGRSFESQFSQLTPLASFLFPKARPYHRYDHVPLEDSRCEGCDCILPLNLLPYRQSPYTIEQISAIVDLTHRQLLFPLFQHFFSLSGQLHNIARLLPTNLRDELKMDLKRREMQVPSAIIASKYSAHHRSSLIINSNIVQKKQLKNDPSGRSRKLSHSSLEADGTSRSSRDYSFQGAPIPTTDVISVGSNGSNLNSSNRLDQPSSRTNTTTIASPLPEIFGIDSVGPGIMPRVDSVGGLLLRSGSGASLGGSENGRFLRERQLSQSLSRRGSTEKQPTYVKRDSTSSRNGSLLNHGSNSRLPSLEKCPTSDDAVVRSRSGTRSDRGDGTPNSTRGNLDINQLPTEIGPDTLPLYQNPPKQPHTLGLDDFIDLDKYPSLIESRQESLPLNYDQWNKMTSIGTPSVNFDSLRNTDTTGLYSDRVKGPNEDLSATEDYHHTNANTSFHQSPSGDLTSFLAPTSPDSTNSPDHRYTPHVVTKTLFQSKQSSKHLELFTDADSGLNHRQTFNSLATTALPVPDIMLTPSSPQRPGRATMGIADAPIVTLTPASQRRTLSVAIPGHSTPGARSSSLSTPVLQSSNLGSIPLGSSSSSRQNPPTTLDLTNNPLDLNASGSTSGTGVIIEKTNDKSEKHPASRKNSSYFHPGLASTLQDLVPIGHSVPPLASLSSRCRVHDLHPVKISQLLQFDVQHLAQECFSLWILYYGLLPYISRRLRRLLLNSWRLEQSEGLQSYIFKSKFPYESIAFLGSETSTANNLRIIDSFNDSMGIQLPDLYPTLRLESPGQTFCFHHSRYQSIAPVSAPQTPHFDNSSGISALTPMSVSNNASSTVSTQTSLYQQYQQPTLLFEEGYHIDVEQYGIDLDLFQPPSKSSTFTSPSIPTAGKVSPSSQSSSLDKYGAYRHPTPQQQTPQNATLLPQEPSALLQHTLNQLQPYTSTTNATGEERFWPRYCPTPGEKHIHLIVLCHGYQGTHWDMRHLRNTIAIYNPGAHFLSSTANEGLTESAFGEMGERLAKEISNYINSQISSKTVHRISFVSHSMGGIISRACLTTKTFAPWLNKCYSYVSLATPHCGFKFGQGSNLVSTGLWLLQKFKRSSSLEQLSLQDEQRKDFVKAYLYKLSQQVAVEFYNTIASSNSDGSLPGSSSSGVIGAILQSNTKNSKSRGNNHDGDDDVRATTTKVMVRTFPVSEKKVALPIDNLEYLIRDLYTIGKYHSYATTALSQSIQLQVQQQQATNGNGTTESTGPNTPSQKSIVHELPSSINNSSTTNQQAQPANPVVNWDKYNWFNSTTSNIGLGMFRYVYIFASRQDSYAPFSSARVQQQTTLQHDISSLMTYQTNSTQHLYPPVPASLSSNPNSALSSATSTPIEPPAMSRGYSFGSQNSPSSLSSQNFFANRSTVPLPPQYKLTYPTPSSEIAHNILHHLSTRINPNVVKIMRPLWVANQLLRAEKGQNPSVLQGTPAIGPILPPYYQQLPQKHIYAPIATSPLSSPHALAQQQLLTPCPHHVTNNQTTKTIPTAAASICPCFISNHCTCPNYTCCLPQVFRRFEVHFPDFLLYGDELYYSTQTRDDGDGSGSGGTDANSNSIGNGNEDDFHFNQGTGAGGSRFMRNFDALVGRAAHISFIDNQQYFEMFMSLHWRAFL